MSPNFVLLDLSLPDLERLVGAMLQAHDAVSRRSWSHPAEPTNEDGPTFWPIPARVDANGTPAIYRCGALSIRSPTNRAKLSSWPAANATGETHFRRDDLIASYSTGYPMPNLLDRLTEPGCPRLGSYWDRCGVHHIEPIETGKRRE
jgi:hypothetical protein